MIYYVKKINRYTKNTLKKSIDILYIYSQNIYIETIWYIFTVNKIHHVTSHGKGNIPLNSSIHWGKFCVDQIFPVKNAREKGTRTAYVFGKGIWWDAQKCVPAVHAGRVKGKGSKSSLQNKIKQTGERLSKEFGWDWDVRIATI